MAKKLSKLQLAQQKAESASKKTNQKINELGQHTGDLYASLTAIQALFDGSNKQRKSNWSIKRPKLKLLDREPQESVPELLLLPLVPPWLWALRQLSVLHLQEQPFLL